MLYVGDLIDLDITGISAEVMIIWRERSRRDLLLSQIDERAQVLVDLLQAVSHLDSYFCQSFSVTELVVGF